MRPPSIDTLTDQITNAMATDDWTATANLGRKLDRLEQGRPAPVLMSSALWYAQQNIPVFPLKPRTKKPATEHGFHDATTDENQIRTWWTKTPDANIGLPTGDTFDAIDIDGPAGIQSRIDHWDEFTMPFLGMVSTPRPGGLHIYIPPSGGRNGTAILPGIDFRGDGGYVVAPPSHVHPAADAGIKHEGTYDWLAPLGQDRTTCQLHKTNLMPDACWTCREITKKSSPEDWKVT